VYVFDGTTLAFYWHAGPFPNWAIAQCLPAVKAASGCSNGV